MGIPFRLNPSLPIYLSEDTDKSLKSCLFGQMLLQPTRGKDHTRLKHCSPSARESPQLLFPQHECEEVSEQSSSLVFTYLHLGMYKPILRSSYDFYYASLKQKHRICQEMTWLIRFLLVIRAAENKSNWKKAVCWDVEYSTAILCSVNNVMVCEEGKWNIIFFPSGPKKRANLSGEVTYWELGICFIYKRNSWSLHILHDIIA